VTLPGILSPGVGWKVSAMAVLNSSKADNKNSEIIFVRTESYRALVSLAYLAGLGGWINISYRYIIEAALDQVSSRLRIWTKYGRF
jgi:hypothetical protein